MWRHVHLDRSLLHLVFIASLCCVVYAQNNTQNNTDDACPELCTGRRFWWTTMWGFIVTLVALSLDVWGSLKAGSTKRDILLAMLSIGALHPLLIVWMMLDQTLKGMTMRSNLREVLGDDMVAPLWPWSKSHIKIIVGCNVIVNLSPDVYEEVCNSNAFLDEEDLGDVSEALVIGIEVRDSDRYNLRLSERGKLALLRSNVLPRYEQLKFLRGSTNLGMTIVAAQAIGYIYGIVVRCGQGLRVSPLEAITCVLNIVILMKVVLHNYASLGHRILLLYLLPQQEAKFIDECRNTMSYQFETGRRLKVGLLVKHLILLVVEAYFIINSQEKSWNGVCVYPIIVFYVSIVLGGILEFRIVGDNTEVYTIFDQYPRLNTIIVGANVAGYLMALFVTFKYWKAEEFDVQSSNYLSQVLPYIG